MMTEVFIAVDRDEVYRLTLPPGEYLIGRDPDVDIRVEHPTISRRHAKLIVAEDHLVLTDLGSGNGTMIEEEELHSPSHFYVGQTARLGDVLMRARQNVTPEALPASIGSYNKGDVVAAGGMGAIHEARQSAMGRKVAMKVMLGDAVEDGRLRRFINEARITGMLEHPNIVPVHELGMDADGRAFYTMKFVHGTTLSGVLAGLQTSHPEAVQKYTLSFLITVFQKVCDAIAFAHSRGVHHRDLKPENIMIGDFGEVLVMDWGLSKETGFASEADDVLPGSQSSDGSGWRTMEGSLLGTPAYMSPEQARGEISSVDERSDIYALGVILHEILYLRPPVSGSSARELIDKVSQGKIDTLPTSPRPHLPGGRAPLSLEAVRRKAMAFDPEQRYQHVTDLQADITAYQSGFATSAESAGLAKHVMLFVKRNKGVAVAVAAGFVVLLCSSVLFTVNLIRERNNANDARDREVEARSQAERDAEIAQKALQEAQASEARAVSSDKKREEALGENEAINANLTRIYGSNEKAAAAIAERSQQQLKDGQFDYAFHNISTAVDLMRENTDYQLKKANLLQTAGKLKEAADIYRAVHYVGNSAQAKDNLDLTEKLIELGVPGSGFTDASLALMDKELMDQNRELELPILHAVANGQSFDWIASDAEAKPAPKDERKLIEKRLTKFTSQSGWNAERLSQRSDGTWNLNLSDLEVGELPKLQGMKIAGLDLRNTGVAKLDNLRGLRLVELDLGGTEVEDLRPLRAMKLERLVLDDTKVRSLEPLRDMPLKRLQAKSDTMEDFSAIGTLKNLEELSLPLRAAGIDWSNLTKLQTVKHPRYCENQAIPAAEFKKIAEFFESHRKDWMERLAAAGVRVKDLPQDRMLMRVPFYLDIDLRGFPVAGVEHLKRIPLRALWLESDKPLDLAGLKGHPSLKHLHLAKADVPSIAPVVKNPSLESIVLSPTSADVAEAASATNLNRLGYETGADGLTPTTTRDEFLGSHRSDQPEILGTRPRIMSRFDEPDDASAGWKLAGADTARTDTPRKRAASPAARGLVWRADPPSTQGRGGGFLAVRDTPGGSYLEAPQDFLNELRDKYGGALEFEVRAPAYERYLRGSDVILAGDGLELHYVAGMRPGHDWSKFLVPLMEHPAWRKGSADGPPVSATEFKNVIGRPQSLRIRTQHGAGNPGARFAGIDDILLWDRRGCELRTEALEEENRATAAWGRDLGLSVESSRETLLDACEQGCEWFLEAGATWLPFYDGKRGVLSVHPPHPTKPATISFRSDKPLPEGTTLLVSGRGSCSEPGVLVDVLVDGRVLDEFVLKRTWEQKSLRLPQNTSAPRNFTIEVRPDERNRENAYFDEIAFILPDGRKQSAPASKTRTSDPTAPSPGDLNRPWIWDGPGLHTPLYIRNGRFIGREDWQYRLAGTRLFVGRNGMLETELQRDKDGNWYGINYPERALVTMTSFGPNAPKAAKALEEMNGKWIWSSGGSLQFVQMWRGKPASLEHNDWKFTPAGDYILCVEIERGRTVEFYLQQDGSWFGSDPRTNENVHFYRASR